MTEMAQGMSQSPETTSSPITSSPTPVSTPTPVSEERTFRQTDVDAIVKKAKHEAVESFRRQQTEQPQYVQQKYGDTTIQQPIQTQVPNEDAFRKLAAQEAQRLRDQWVQDSYNASKEAEAKQIAEKFVSTINVGKQKFQDFESKTATVNWAKYPNAVRFINEFDNGESIIYEFGNNPMKLVQFEQIAAYDPDLARAEMKRLASSIKENETASNIKIPREPLSQLRPSNAGMDSREWGVKDARLKYKG